MEIGRRQVVENIRQVWPHETGFSKWLASEDGLALIAQDLGIEIEDAQLECRPGDFPCDIVGHLVGDEDHRVVIENQYGKTDHDHLGKLLTYASVHKATIGIWITERASGDHRQVIDWLNANTPDTINLYLCELKAYKIGNSPVAPQLDVICRPNESVKPLAIGGSDADKMRHAWRQAFWTEIVAHLKATNPPFNLQKPGRDHWSSIAIGKSGFHVSMLLTPKNKSVGVELYVQPQGWKQAAYDQLFAQRSAIESELGTKLQWQPMPDKKSSRILWEHKVDPSNPENREAIKNWFREATPKLHAAFRGRVASLVIPAGTTAEDDPTESAPEEELVGSEGEM